MPRSFVSHLSHIASSAAVDIAVNLASAVDLAVIFCLVDRHKTALLP
jgi:hypothetical protein